MSGLRDTVDQLKDRYRQCATEKDGKTVVDKSKVAELLRKEYDSGDTNPAEIDEFFKNLDKDGDGVVSFKEFVGFVMTVTDILDEMKK